MKEADAGTKSGESLGSGRIEYVSYKDERQLPDIMALIDQELSEPYSIFTYRYFITLWPDLCFLALHEGKCIGTIVCKMEQHRNTFRGYIAMLVVVKQHRGKGVATELVTRCVQVMHDAGCDEVTMEAEVTNLGALTLYGNLGFIRAKRLHRYYLNGVDAYRLKLLFPRPPDTNSLFLEGGYNMESYQVHDCSKLDHHHGHNPHDHQHCGGHDHGHSHASQYHMYS